MAQDTHPVKRGPVERWFRRHWRVALTLAALLVFSACSAAWQHEWAWMLVRLGGVPYFATAGGITWRRPI
jgi:hypothetical protein